jgi:CRP-like cAMP-binding protein
MKNQGLPKKLQQEVIGYLTYTQALLSSQQELEIFLNLVSPSLKEKAIKHIFSEVLRENPIFEGNDQLIDYLTRKLITKIYQPEEQIVSQGDVGDKIYFIAKGGGNVTIRNRNNIKIQVNKLFPGDLFGEVAILNDCRRTATVTANNYSTIAYLSKELFYNIFNKNQVALKVLKDGRKNYQDEWKVFMKDNLRYITYMKSLDNDTIEDLTYYLKEEIYQAGDIIFRAGDTVNKVYMIANGEIDIFVKIGKKEVVLDVLYQACNIGEYGILGDYKYTFTARVKKDATHMIYLTKDCLEICRTNHKKLDTEIEICSDWLENSGLPLVDFRLYRNMDSKKCTIEILKLAIARVMRINDALDSDYTPEEITELLQRIQIRVFGEGNDDENLQKNSNRMLQEVLQRLAHMVQDNQALKLQIAKFEIKVSRIQKNVSVVKAEITGDPNTYMSSESSEPQEEGGLSQEEGESFEEGSDSNIKSF